jgi:hypothetical protein
VDNLWITCGKIVERFLKEGIDLRLGGVQKNNPYSIKLAKQRLKISYN